MPGGFAAFGAGGGPSRHYAQPAYQAGTVPTALARAGSREGASRVTPDVAMLGDLSTGLKVGLEFDGQYVEVPIAGTSLASPLFVASVALAQQRSGRHFGFLNPVLYSANGALRDVRPIHPTATAILLSDPIELTTFDYHGPENTLATAPGYDDVTGLGSADGVRFLRALEEAGRR